MTIYTNEDRASRGEDIIALVDQNDPLTMASDAISYIYHYCDRYGIDRHELLVYAGTSYMGDREDGPYARRLSSRDDCPHCADGTCTSLESGV